MLRAVIKSEWANGLSEADITNFNTSRRAELFINTVNFRGLGGYSMRLMERAGDKYFPNPHPPILNRANMRLWRPASFICLAFDQPGVIAYPLHEPSFQGGQAANMTAIAEMDDFLRAASQHGDMLSGNERVILPLAGIAIDEFTYPGDMPLPTQAQVQEAMIGIDRL